MVRWTNSSINEKECIMQQMKEMLDSLGKLPPSVQLALVIGVFTLLVLLVINPVAGASISGFLLSLKALFGSTKPSGPRPGP
jgi:hypothetical protein